MANLRLTESEVRTLLLWSKQAIDRAEEVGLPFEADERTLRIKLETAIGENPTCMRKGCGERRSEHLNGTGPCQHRDPSPEPPLSGHLVDDYQCRAFSAVEAPYSPRP
jgi:hypothetical protein